VAATAPMGGTAGMVASALALRLSSIRHPQYRPVAGYRVELHVYYVHSTPERPAPHWQSPELAGSGQQKSFGTLGVSKQQSIPYCLEGRLGTSPVNWL
jgi:hypothetical protein